MKTKALLIAAVGFFALSGVTRHDTDESEYLALAKQTQFDCVGKIIGVDGVGGTCVLIGERYVLTAAHVFVESDVTTDTIFYNGQTVIANRPVNQRVGAPKNYQCSFGSGDISVHAITLHPSYQLENGSGVDLALVELQEPVKDITLAKPVDKSIELGTQVVGVGFGASGVASRPETVEALDKKIAGENVVDSIGGMVHAGNATMLYCDFDHPTDTTCCNKMGSAIPLKLEYLAAGGDSGGGLFFFDGKQWQLVGILSGAPTDIDQLLAHGYYGQTMQWTRVSTQHDWIKSNTTR